jgi:hypothetical protein
LSESKKEKQQDPDIGRASDTGSRIPYDNTAGGGDDTPVEHTYQTADGREVTETIPAADATFIPNKLDGEIEAPHAPDREKAA